MADVFDKVGDRLIVTKTIPEKQESLFFDYGYLVIQREAAYQEFLKAQQNLDYHDTLIAEAKKFNLDK